jgi:sugar phosphate isomerase/epimerase
MLDTFHSNIEETSIPKAIRRAGRLLKHVHFADSNRLAPGFGSIDFKPIMRELIETEYDGYIDLECMPAKPDPDTLVQEGLGYMRSIESLAKIQVRSN